MHYIYSDASELVSLLRATLTILPIMLSTYSTTIALYPNVLCSYVTKAL